MSKPPAAKLAAVFSLLFVLPLVNFGQEARELTGVKRIYVEASSHNRGLGELKSDLISQLRKSGFAQVVSAPSQADAVLAANGEIWVKGYYSLNPRSGISPSNGKPVYSGFLSVELKGKGSETIWSYLVTPKIGSTATARDLSKEAVRQLSLAIANTAHK